MMHIFSRFLLSLVLLANVAYADSIGLNLKGVTVPELAEALIKGAMGRDYVLTPAAAVVDQRLTVSIRQADKDKLPVLLSDLLRGAGVTVEDRGGVLYLDKSAQVEGASEFLFKRGFG